MKPQKMSAQKPPTGPRRGSFMIVAMICLLMTTALLGTVLEMVVLGRQQARLDAAGLQADWLAESALDRAAARLAADAGYQGETWNIPPEDLDGTHPGQAVITVKPDGEDGKVVAVVARYPLEGPQSVQRTRRLPVRVAADAASASPASAEKPEDREDNES